jgi:hypothetical protein
MKEEFIIAREYIHKESIGNEQKIRTKALPLTSFLEEHFKKKTIDGCSATLVRSKEKARKKLIFSNYKKETNDIYPFLYIAVQFFDTTEKELIEAFLLKNGCVSIHLET